MAEYINRDEFFGTIYWKYSYGKSGLCRGVRDVIQDIKDAPVADVAPIVHGKLIDNKYCVFCSVCGYHWYHCDDGIQEFNYCPNCGAKMDKE